MTNCDYKDRREASRARLLQDDSTTPADVDQLVPAFAERANEVNAEEVDTRLNAIGGNVVAALDAQPVHDRSPEVDQTSIGKQRSHD